MSKFTKGKWKAFYGEKFHTIHQAHADDEQGHDYGNGELIAHVVQWHKGHDWANARLIAAAPEMYDAITECADTLQAIKNADDCNEAVRLYDVEELIHSLWELLARIDGKED